MRTFVSRIPFGLLLALLSGCAYLYQPGPALDQQVGVWTRQQDYGDALDVLTRLSAAYPGNARLKAELASTRRHAAIYETTTLRAARELEKGGNWRAAALLYRQGLDTLPRSTHLRAAQASFRRHRRAYINTLEAQIIVGHARYLIATLPLHERRNRVGGTDSRSVQTLEDERQQAAHLGTQLTAMGQAALADRDYRQAGEVFGLAQRLHPGPVSRAGLKTVHRYYQTQTRRHARAQAARAKTRRAVLERTYTAYFKRCYQRRDWLCARQALATLAQVAPNAKALPALQHRLAAQIHNTVRHGLETGRQRYSQGQIRKALDIWLRVRKLAPQDAELAAHITRARKVLAKLQELRIHPATPVPSAAAPP